LRRAVAELAVAEDRQRRRLARDLHDHIVQDLALATLKLRTVGRPRAMRKGIAYDDLRALMDRIVREARSLVLEVCPSVLDDSGLAAAIEWLAERHTRVTGVPCTVYSSSAAPRLSSDEQVLVFQIVRELLMNARKHATPTRVRIEHGVRAGLYRVEVVDDGCGFDPDEAGGSSVGLGLDHARDRLDLAGGRIESDSVPGRGTRVRIAIPLRPSGAGVESDEGAADIR
jgi:two-component system NarL family sensor kinase